MPFFQVNEFRPFSDSSRCRTEAVGLIYKEAKHCNAFGVQYANAKNEDFSGRSLGKLHISVGFQELG